MPISNDYDENNHNTLKLQQNKLLKNDDILKELPIIAVGA